VVALPCWTLMHESSSLPATKYRSTSSSQASSPSSSSQPNQTHDVTLSACFSSHWQKQTRSSMQRNLVILTSTNFGHKSTLAAWNQLPSEISNLQSMGSFKSGLTCLPALTVADKHHDFITAMVLVPCYSTYKLLVLLLFYYYWY